MFFRHLAGPCGQAINTSNWSGKIAKPKLGNNKKKSPRLCFALYFVGDGARDEKYSAARNHVIQNWNDLNHEDIGIVERMQKGRESEGFDGGVLSPYWDPVLQYFARLMSESIAARSIPDS